MDDDFGDLNNDNFHHELPDFGADSSSDEDRPRAPSRPRVKFDHSTAPKASDHHTAKASDHHTAKASDHHTAKASDHHTAKPAPVTKPAAKPQPQPRPQPAPQRKAENGAVSGGAGGGAGGGGAGGGGPRARFGGYGSLEEFNMALMVQVERLETECQALKVKVARSSVPAPSLPAPTDSDDLKDAKIAELAKANRSLTQAVGKERAAIVKVEGERDDALARVRNLEVQLADASQALLGSQPRGKEDDGGSATAANTNNKLAEMRAQLDLAKEQVKKLKAEADQSREQAAKAARLAAAAAPSRDAATARSSASSSSAAPAPPSAAIASIAQSRQKEMDSMLAELQLKKEELSSLKLKHDAASSRVKTLEVDAKKNKERLAVLMEKSKADDDLIEDLKSKVRQLATGASKAPSSSTSSSEEAASLRAQLDEFKTRCAELTQQVAAKDRQIVDAQRRDKTGGADSGAPLPAVPEKLVEAVNEFAAGEIRVLRAKSASLEEMLRSLRQRSEAAELEAVAREQRLRAVKREADAKTAELAALASKDKGKKPAPPPTPQESELASMRERIEFLQDETELLKISLRGASKKREDEIAGFMKLVEEQRALNDERLKALMKVV